MSFFNSLSLRTKLLATMALLLLLLAAGLIIANGRALERTYYAQANQDNELSARSLAYFLNNRYRGVTTVDTPDGQLQHIVWDDPPESLDNHVVDMVQAVTGLEASVFMFQAATGGFTRVATTVRDDSGQVMTGTDLTDPNALDAIDRRTAIQGQFGAFGTNYIGIYVPILSRDGQVIGAMGAGRDYAAFRTSIAEASNIAGTTALSFFLVAAILSLAFLVLRALLAPLNSISTAIHDLTTGKYESEIRHADRKDEIGEIFHRIVALQFSMKEAESLKVAEADRMQEDEAKRIAQECVVNSLSDGLSSLADLDLTARIDNTEESPFPAEYDALRTSFNRVIDQLAETIVSIRDVAEEVKGDAGEMSSSANDLSNRTESQAATLQQSAAALEQLSQSIKSTAENAAAAESETSNNRAATKKTGEVVESAVTAMSEIEASSKQITHIISVIEDIAFQTNLLALNAGVEAARAGEAGRGFAVVASEVRALAQHSSASAQEIKALIAASSEQVETGSRLVRDTGQALNDIIDRVDTVASLVSDIAASAKEQAIGVEEINDGVRNLDMATQSNAAMAEEASSASDGLTNAAAGLANLIARFQLGQVSSGNWAAAAAAAESTSSSAAEEVADREIAIAMPLDTAANADAFRGF